MNLSPVITKPKKHRTRVPGVSVTLSASGGFTVTATAAAVKRWPWDGTSWPCADLHRAHRFTFENTGELADIETSQRDTEDGENGRAVGGLADDCKALAVDLISGLADKKPGCVSHVLFDDCPKIDGKGFSYSTADKWTFVFRHRKGEANPGKRLCLFTCDSGRGFSQCGEACLSWINESRPHRVKWEAVPAALRRHVKARLAEVEPPPRFKVWTRGNRGRYFPTLEAAQAAAEAVRKETGFFLLITEEKGARK